MNGTFSLQLKGVEGVDNFTQSTSPSKSRKPPRIVIIMAAVCLTIALLPLINKAVADMQKKAAEEKFQEVCEYVEQNEDIYRKFSEYQLSILKIGPENQTWHYVDVKGDFQSERDIVLHDVMNANAYYIRDDHNRVTDRKAMSYMIYAGKNYRVLINYTEADISDRDIEQEYRMYRMFGDNMFVYLYELDPALRHI